MPILSLNVGIFFGGEGSLIGIIIPVLPGIDVQREKKKQPVPHSNPASNPDDHYLRCCALRLGRWLYLQASVSWVRRYLSLDLPRSSDEMMALL